MVVLLALTVTWLLVLPLLTLALAALCARRARRRADVTVPVPVRYVQPRSLRAEGLHPAPPMGLGARPHRPRSPSG